MLVAAKKNTKSRPSAKNSIYVSNIPFQYPSAAYRNLCVLLAAIENDYGCTNKETPHICFCHPTKKSPFYAAAAPLIARKSSSDKGSSSFGF